MVFGKNNKLKVVWVCHFSNSEIHTQLGVKKNINDFAPWISIGIEEAKKRGDVELHIVAPYRWLSKNREFELDGIYYHFFNYGIPLIGRHWPRFFRWDVWTKFKHSKNKIFKLISKINPDIIHLHGFENPYYSICALDERIKEPFLVTVQGFITKAAHSQHKKMLSVRQSIEIDIIKSKINFGVRNQDMKDSILQYNSKANLYWHEYFINIPKSRLHDNDEFIYDIIFYATVSKDKGIEDLIKSISIIKDKGVLIKVAIVGGGSQSYIEKLKMLCKKLAIESHVYFLGFQETQDDVFKILNNSKICVLPTYNDIIPGTIIESMFSKTPVISYKTGGIPEINNDKTRILLCDKGDINALSDNILLLLKDKTLYYNLTDTAYEYAKRRWSNEDAINSIITAYKKILSSRLNLLID